MMANWDYCADMIEQQVPGLCLTLSGFKRSHSILFPSLQLSSTEHSLEQALLSFLVSQNLHETNLILFSVLSKILPNLGYSVPFSYFMGPAKYRRSPFSACQLHWPMVYTNSKGTSNNQQEIETEHSLLNGNAKRHELKNLDFLTSYNLLHTLVNHITCHGKMISSTSTEPSYEIMKQYI